MTQVMCAPPAAIITTPKSDIQHTGFASLDLRNESTRYRELFSNCHIVRGSAAAFRGILERPPDGAGVMPQRDRDGRANSASAAGRRWDRLAKPELLEHRAAEGAADERGHMA